MKISRIFFLFYHSTSRNSKSCIIVNKSKSDEIRIVFLSTPELQLQIRWDLAALFKGGRWGWARFAATRTSRGLRLAKQFDIAMLSEPSSCVNGKHMGNIWETMHDMIRVTSSSRLAIICFDHTRALGYLAAKAQQCAAHARKQRVEKTVGSVESMLKECSLHLYHPANLHQPFSSCWSVIFVSFRRSGKKSSIP